MHLLSQYSFGPHVAAPHFTGAAVGAGGGDVGVDPMVGGGIVVIGGGDDGLGTGLGEGCDEAHAHTPMHVKAIAIEPTRTAWACVITSSSSRGTTPPPAFDRA